MEHSLPIAPDYHIDLQCELLKLRDRVELARKLDQNLRLNLADQVTYLKSLKFTVKGELKKGDEYLKKNTMALVDAESDIESQALLLEHLVIERDNISKEVIDTEYETAELEFQRIQTILDIERQQGLKLELETVVLTIQMQVQHEDMEFDEQRIALRKAEKKQKSLELELSRLSDEWERPRQLSQSNGSEDNDTLILQAKPDPVLKTTELHDTVKEGRDNEVEQLVNGLLPPVYQNTRWMQEFAARIAKNKPSLDQKKVGLDVENNTREMAALSQKKGYLDDVNHRRGMHMLSQKPCKIQAAAHTA